MSDDLEILLTNDDGIDSTGIRALYDALSEHANVTVVAPADDRSACGRSLSHEVEVDDHELGYAVYGTPADCVVAGLAELGPFPDLVVAGCNKERISASTSSVVRERSVRPSKPPSSTSPRSRPRCTSPSTTRRLRRPRYPPMTTPKRPASRAISPSARSRPASSTTPPISTSTFRCRTVNPPRSMSRAPRNATRWTPNATAHTLPFTTASGRT